MFCQDRYPCASITWPWRIRSITVTVTGPTLRPRLVNQGLDHSASILRCCGGTCSCKVEYWPFRPDNRGCSQLARSHPKVAAMLDDARPDLLAFAGFPQRHWRQIWSTNPLERVNKEIKRRTDVVGVFPNPAALLRLAGAVLVEQHDEWEAGNRRYLLRIVDARVEDHEHPDRTGRGGESSCPNLSPPRLR